MLIFHGGNKYRKDLLPFRSIIDYLYLQYEPSSCCFNLTVDFTSHFSFFLFPFLKLAEVFAKDGMSFLASFQNLLPRPWVIDDLDNFKMRWQKKSWKKVSIMNNQRIHANFLFAYLYKSQWSQKLLEQITCLCTNGVFHDRLLFLLITLVQILFWASCLLQESCFSGVLRFALLDYTYIMKHLLHFLLLFSC